ncbi:ATP-NAD kinase family protein [Stygiolobus caldivivus]|uniref:ATP-NAD kinase n=1 Tax=Stygiolobus caldivivus TaxID=2824673 RepID=A0A8D5ZGR6_9CREN|nr:ATP-NAD kinase family protein [Stygiolobus caldivivus]BCU71188.1 ATP-NAD kinase [Stygiolobus caldivivus]
MTKTICLLVNPVAGSGGRIGYKGSDSLHTYNQETPLRMARFLSTAPKDSVIYVVAPREMGEDYFKNTQLNYRVIDITIHSPTLRVDTINALNYFLEKESCNIIVFAGGDGTARDVYSVVKDTLPVLGIPTGVKMHSGVFANTPEGAGILLRHFVQGKTEVIITEILDIDEEAYRQGKYNVKLFGYARTINYSNLIVPNKEEIISEKEEVDEIAQYVIDKELSNPDITYVIGPGSTTKNILRKIGIETNFLCTDILQNMKLIKSCANYDDLLNLTGELKLILTPIGRQGFLIGRGNQEIGPLFLRKLLRIESNKVERDNIIVVSTRSKLYTFDCLRIDSGDPKLDNLMKGVYKVIVGYDEFVAVKTCDITD